MRFVFKGYHWGHSLNRWGACPNPLNLTASVISLRRNCHIPNFREVGVRDEKTIDLPKSQKKVLAEQELALYETRPCPKTGGLREVVESEA